VSRNGVHMLCIDQDDLITPFQKIENGTPIDASDARELLAPLVPL
jgi:hypothetical protein